MNNQLTDIFSHISIGRMDAKYSISKELYAQRMIILKQKLAHIIHLISVCYHGQLEKYFAEMPRICLTSPMKFIMFIRKLDPQLYHHIMMVYACFLEISKLNINVDNSIEYHELICDRLPL